MVLMGLILMIIIPCVIAAVLKQETESVMSSHITFTIDEDELNIKALLEGASEEERTIALKVG